MEQAFQLALIRPQQLPQTLTNEESQEDISLPGIYKRPPQPHISFRGKINIEKSIKDARACHNQKNHFVFERIFIKLQGEFGPLLSWAISCWDYILTTEGVRFLPKTAFQRLFQRGYYRAFQQKDFFYLVNLTFKKCILEYSENAFGNSFLRFIKRNFWELILTEYRSLEKPQDIRQRNLTGYSYLRCIPYKFLNSYHQNRVKSLLNRLPTEERRIVNLYFLNFLTEQAVAKESRITQIKLKALKKRALFHIKRQDSLVWALLLQVERY